MSGKKRPPRFFPDGSKFRAWLEQNHARETELLVGFHKKDAGMKGISYAEAVEEALCFGWIDGLLRKIDEQRYCLRFTPRKTGSNWSLVNVARVQRLSDAGRMRPSGIAAFKNRSAAKTGIYSFERKEAAVLPTALEKRFRANRKAWAFFMAQAPSYQRLMLHKIVSAKQETTKQRWLLRVITASSAGQRVDA